MIQRDIYDGGDAPFEGDRVLLLRSIRAGAQIINATATITPIDNTSGSDPFTEKITLGAGTASGDFGTTKTVPANANWVEVDFHARRKLAAVESTAAASLQVDLGGGAYVDISNTGGFLGPAPNNTPFPVAAGVTSLPGLIVTKFKLTGTTAAFVDVLSVTIRSVPSNVSLRLGSLRPFSTHLGELVAPETTADFSAVLQAFLTTAKVENGFYQVPLTLHSDSLARLRVDIQIDHVDQLTTLPPALSQVVVPYDFSTTPQPQADVLQVSLPADARILPEQSSAQVRGAFAPTRLVPGVGAPSGLVSTSAFAAIAPTTVQAQPFRLDSNTGATGVDLLIVPVDRTVQLTLDLRADFSGKPDDTPLLPAPVAFTLDRDAARQSNWVSVTLPAEFQFAAKQSYWLVVQSLVGTANWSVQPAASPSQGMQRTQDGGASWRVTIASSGSSSVAGPQAGVFRLRRVPKQFQVPIEFQAGPSGQETRVKLDRFAPLGRVDFAPNTEIAAGVSQFLRQQVQKTSPGCPEGEHLANGNFEQWTVTGDDVQSADFIPLGSAESSPTPLPAIAATPDSTQVYLITGDSTLQGIDVLCDRPSVTIPLISDTASSSGSGVASPADFVVIHPSGTKAFVVVGLFVHLVDLQRSADSGTPYPLVPITPLGFKGLVISPDGTRLYATGQDTQKSDVDNLLTLDSSVLEGNISGKPKTDPIVASLPLDHQAQDIAISPDGATIYVLEAATDGSGSIHVIDVSGRGSSQRVIPTDSHPIAIALAPDGRQAVIISRTTPSDRTPAETRISIFDTLSGNPVIPPINPGINLDSPAVAISPNGARMFVVGFSGGGGVITWIAADFRGKIIKIPSPRTLPIGGGPVAVAITPHGDRVYAAFRETFEDAALGPLFLSVGVRSPADWALTSGQLALRCFSDANDPGLTLGDTNNPSSLSQVVPVAGSCTYEFTFLGLATQKSGVPSQGEVLWLGTTCTSPKQDSIYITVGDVSGSRRSVLATHRLRMQAPAVASQAEVRFTVPAGETALIAQVSLSATAQALANSDLSTLDQGVPAGWKITSQAGVAFLPEANGVLFQNSGAAKAEAVQTIPAKPTQSFTLEFQGKAAGRVNPQQSPTIEVHWLAASGTPAGPATVLNVGVAGFDRSSASGVAPGTADKAEVHIVLPAGTSLHISNISLQFSQTISVPVSFIAESPGELTVSDLRIGYDRTVVPPPPVPPGGLCTPTPPDQTPGAAMADGSCHCLCCGAQQTMTGVKAVVTSAGRPASEGRCIVCGTKLLRIGGQLVAGAPPNSLTRLPLHRPLKAGGRSPVPKPPPAASGPLTPVTGLADAKVQQLGALGSLARLAATSPDELAHVLPGVPVEAAAGFIEQARKLAGISVRGPDLPRTPEKVPEEPPITTVAGIDEARAGQMAAIGIDSLHKLASAKPETLAALEGVSAEMAASFIEQARKLVEPDKGGS
jgi:hypothetical protein